MQEMALKVIYPTEMSRTFVIPKNGLVIGRSADADFVLEDEWISRKHCKLFWQGTEVWVEDLNSTNGTFLDGSEVKSSLLDMESNLQLGKIVLKLDWTASPANSLLDEGEVHPLTGLKSYSSGQEDINRFFEEHEEATIFNISMSYAEVAREDFGPDASDFLTFEVGRIIAREILSDELLVHGNEFQYFLLSPETSSESSKTLVKELCKICSKQVFSFEGSPLQGDVDITYFSGAQSDSKNFIESVL